MTELKENLEMIRNMFMKDLERAEKTPDLDQIRVRFLGKKGELTQVLRGMGGLSAEERPAIGQIANRIREEMEESIKRKEMVLSTKEERRPVYV